MSAAIFCALLMCVGMCACTEPIPAEDLDTRGSELEDSTQTAQLDFSGDGGWKDPVTIGFGFGPGAQEGGSDE